MNDLDRLVSLTGLIFIRWDITWNYLKSLRHTNRFGPLHSHFNSFVLQTINNALPTIDNLLKRLPQLYTGWSCLFCHRSDETLLHLFTCPSTNNQWAQIEQSAINKLTSWCSINHIRLPASPESLLTTPICISSNPNLQHLVAIRALAGGKVPAYIMSNMDLLNVRSHRAAIIGNLLHGAMKGFREYLWKPRCKLQADEEKRRNISPQDKRNYAGNTAGPSSRPPDQNQDRQNKWEEAINRGSDMFSSFIKRGQICFKKGWGTSREFLGKNMKL